MTDAPLLGATNATDTWLLPGVPTTPVGALGTVDGVTGNVDADGALLPALLVAVTVNVYEVPLVKPVTVKGLVNPLAVKLPGDEVTV